MELERQSFDSLVESLGLSPEERKSLPLLLKNVRHEVLGALEELKTITTHDDNLEKQYKETVEDNLTLASSLDKAKREIRNLKGKLSILEMTKAEIREEKARKKVSVETLAEYNKDLRKRDMKSRTHIMSRRERSFTVNSKGQYFQSVPVKVTNLKRHQTFHVRPHQEALPPPVCGCSCSICQSVQTLGATPMAGGTQHARGIAKSGQQILIQDKVVVRGQKTGTVKYIGRLNDDPALGTYIGVELDAPAGANDGTHRKKRYFECRDHHGVFVRPHDILCVTQRKPMMSTAISPRRKLLPPMKRDSTAATKDSSQHVILYKAKETSSQINPADQVESELLRIANREDLSLYQGSVASMTRRLKVLKYKTVTSKEPVSVEPVQPSGKVSPVEEPARSRSDSHRSTAGPTPSTTTPKRTLPLEETTQAPGAIAEPELVQQPPPASTPSGVSTQSSAGDAFAHVLEEELQKRDLGTTGFVTGGEIFAVLTSPPVNAYIKSDGTEMGSLLDSLGIERNDTQGVGVPYQELILQLVSTLCLQDE